MTRLLARRGPIAYLLYGPAVVFAVACATAYVHDALGFAWRIAYLIAINLVALVVYAYDKVFIVLLKFLHLRVPEKVLIWELTFPGGVIGALFGMLIADHKTGTDTRDFRAELCRAYALSATVMLILILINCYWPLLSQVDILISKGIGLVLSVGAMLWTAIRPQIFSAFRTVWRVIK